MRKSNTSGTNGAKEQTSKNFVAIMATKPAIKNVSPITFSVTSIPTRIVSFKVGALDNNVSLSASTLKRSYVVILDTPTVIPINRNMMTSAELVPCWSGGDAFTTAAATGAMVKPIPIPPKIKWNAIMPYGVSTLHVLINTNPKTANTNPIMVGRR